MSNPAGASRATPSASSSSAVGGMPQIDDLINWGEKTLAQVDNFIFNEMLPKGYDIAHKTWFEGKGLAIELINGDAQGFITYGAMMSGLVLSCIAVVLLWRSYLRHIGDLDVQSMLGGIKEGANDVYEKAREMSPFSPKKRASLSPMKGDTPSRAGSPMSPKRLSTSPKKEDKKATKKASVAKRSRSASMKPAAAMKTKSAMKKAKSPSPVKAKSPARKTKASRNASMKKRK